MLHGIQRWIQPVNPCPVSPVAAAAAGLRQHMQPNSSRNELREMSKQHWRAKTLLLSFSQEGNPWSTTHQHCHTTMKKRSIAGIRSDKLLAAGDYKQWLQLQGNIKPWMKTENTFGTMTQVCNSLASLICKEENTKTLKYWVVHYNAVLGTLGYAQRKKHLRWKEIKEELCWEEKR